jgi:hypothetical protein
MVTEAAELSVPGGVSGCCECSDSEKVMWGAICLKYLSWASRCLTFSSSLDLSS